MWTADYAKTLGLSVTYSISEDKFLKQTSLTLQLTYNQVHNQCSMRLEDSHQVHANLNSPVNFFLIASLELA